MFLELYNWNLNEQNIVFHHRCNESKVQMGCQVTKRKIVKIYGTNEVKIYENYFTADTRAILSACQHMKKHINIWSVDDK